MLWCCQFDALFVTLSVTKVGSLVYIWQVGAYMLVFMRIHFTLFGNSSLFNTYARVIITFISLIPLIKHRVYALPNDPSIAFSIHRLVRRVWSYGLPRAMANLSTMGAHRSKIFWSISRAARRS